MTDKEIIDRVKKALSKANDYWGKDKGMTNMDYTFIGKLYHGLKLLADEAKKNENHQI